MIKSAIIFLESQIKIAHLQIKLRKPQLNVYYTHTAYRISRVIPLKSDDNINPIQTFSSKKVNTDQLLPRISYFSELSMVRLERIPQKIKNQATDLA